MNNEQLQISLDNFINAFTNMLDRIPSRIIKGTFDADNVLHLTSIHYNEIVLLSASETDHPDLTHTVYIDLLDIDYPIYMMVNDILDLMINIGGKSYPVQLSQYSMINIIPVTNSDKKEYVLYVNPLDDVKEVRID